MTCALDKGTHFKNHDNRSGHCRRRRHGTTERRPRGADHRRGICRGSRRPGSRAWRGVVWRANLHWPTGVCPCACPHTGGGDGGLSVGEGAAIQEEAQGLRGHNRAGTRLLVAEHAHTETGRKTQAGIRRSSTWPMCMDICIHTCIGICIDMCMDMCLCLWGRNST